MTTVPRIAYQPIAHPKAEKTVKIDKNLKISINLLFLNTLVSILFTLYGIRPHHHQPTKKKQQLKHFQAIRGSASNSIELNTQLGIIV